MKIIFILLPLRIFFHLSRYMFLFREFYFDPNSHYTWPHQPNYTFLIHASFPIYTLPKNIISIILFLLKNILS